MKGYKHRTIPDVRKRRLGLMKQMLKPAVIVLVLCCVAALADWLLFGGAKFTGFVALPLFAGLMLYAIIWSQKTRRLVCPECNRELTASSPERFPCSKCEIIWRTDTLFGIGE